MSLYVTSTPVLSTVHLTPELMEKLRGWAGSHDVPQMVFGTVACYPEGFWMRVYGSHPLSLANTNIFAPEFMPIFEWFKFEVRRKSCRFDGSWIRFDADGDVIPELPQYQHA